MTGIQGRSHKQQLNDFKETRILEIESGRTRSHIGELTFKRLWICRKTDYGMNESLHKGEGACVLSLRKLTLFRKT